MTQDAPAVNPGITSAHHSKNRFATGRSDSRTSSRRRDGAGRASLHCADRVGGFLRDADPRQPFAQACAQCGAGERARENADERDADLHGREEAARIVGEPHALRIGNWTAARVRPAELA